VRHQREKAEGEKNIERLISAENIRPLAFSFFDSFFNCFLRIIFPLDDLSRLRSECDNFCGGKIDVRLVNGRLPLGEC